MEIAVIVCVLVVLALVGLLFMLLNRLTEYRVAEAAARAKTDADAKRMADMDRHYQVILAESKAQFAALSQEVLKERGEELAKVGFDGIKVISDSLKEDIAGFKKRLNEVNEQDVGRVATMTAEINNLLNQTNRVSNEANHLAAAIRGKAQVTGQWAEMQLKKVLELGGLKESIDYTYQETFASPESTRKNLRTDVLLKLPEDRWLVIDSKATVEAYVDFDAAEEGSAAAQVAYGKIVESIKNHVKEMSVASYAKNIEKTRGVRVHPKMLMYIPFEEVYLIAMKEKFDSERLLRDWAWDNDVVFVNASSLLPIATMLCEFWARRKADKKANDVIVEAAKLLEKCSLFINDFVKIGSGLENAVAAYNESLKKLATGNGNVMKRLADIQELGVKMPANAKTAGEVEEKTVEGRVEKLTA